ncbi:hypothetical protein sphantq_02979 [Sphingobium sp. AntQ-1]|uniref:hypothetical protein n=1 Tax=Sphingobium sp. AntQ-1 TaxID=2930091 RepID=UPI00234F7DA2|nr:hypothetical protein [Sphingobium sp. AntQ-1]WCP14533.1 hypothetical protein sphantq_02979 [Sphingobium sp. AntQ-1]
MSFFGLMTVKAHEAAMAVFISDRAKAMVDAQQERETAGRLLGKNVALRSEVAALTAELATLKAERDRRLAPLIAANAERAAASAAKRAGKKEAV